DRLILDENRVEDIIDGINTVINFDDPIWASNHVWTLENGLTVSKMNVPLGVIGIIYESRPNVTVDAFALSLKSGNCILLRGSSSAINSNKALVKVIKEGLVESEISENVIELIEDTDRSIINQMIKLNKYIDVIIPRGGSDLIRTVVDNATVPTIETGIGNCHIFVDESGKLEDAINIIKNAKVQRPGVCNACETILVHEAIAEKFLPILEEHLSDKVELRGCLETKRLIHVEETVKDWGEEYLDYILAIKIVTDIDEAIEHIRKYGSKHSESIITEDFTNGNYFLRRVDAATVYINASNRFTDGVVFGFGGVMGDSNLMFSARVIIGLNE